MAKHKTKKLRTSTTDTNGIEASGGISCTQQGGQSDQMPTILANSSRMLRKIMKKVPLVAKIAELFMLQCIKSNLQILVNMIALYKTLMEIGGVEKTVLAEVWNLPEGNRIVVDINKEKQPIGDKGGVLGFFLGTIARNGKFCSLSYTRWDHLKKGNNQNNQVMILREVQSLFLYHKSLEKWKLNSIGHKWRDYKCLLKGRYYDEVTNITTLHDNCPNDVEKDQWISLVNLWRSDEGQKRRKRSLESHDKAKVKPIHTTGTKNNARVHEDLDHTKKIVAEEGDKEVSIDDDPVSKVSGKDKYGRVCGLGLGVKPSDLVDPSNSSSYSSLNMSTKNKVVLLYYLYRLKELMQELRKHVKRQDIAIMKLKRKPRSPDDSGSDDSDSDDYP